MAGRGKKKKGKKGIAKIGEHADFYEIFKTERKSVKKKSFAEVLEENLDQDKLQEAITQKTSKNRAAEPEAVLPDKEVKELPPQQEIDLHGLTSAEAELKLESFFQTVKGKGFITVRVITGKGLHSDGPAVLRNIAEQKIAELQKRNLVVSYRWEKKTREKSGSMIVVLS